MSSRRRSSALAPAALAALALVTAAPAAAQEGSPPPSVAWQEGPATASIGSRAEVKLPAGFRFAGEKDTQALLQAMGNPTSGAELGLVMPAQGDWFVVFEFSETGHVKDDDKDKLDAGAILKSIQEGNARSNQERKKRGWTTIEVVGWEQPPSYNPETHNLEWAVRGQSEGNAVVNFNTRLLGRKGVMEANLVCDPAELATVLPTYRQLLAGTSYQSGERYAEFRPGDKVAAYGLTALVAGGAAAVALKTGLLQKFWKLIVVGVIALAGALKKLVASIFSRRSIGPTGR